MRRRSASERNRDGTPIGRRACLSDVRLGTYDSSIMCGIAGYSLSACEPTSTGRSRRRRCSPGSPSAARTRSGTPGAPAARGRGPQAALRRERAARAAQRAAAGDAGARPRPRLHEGPPVDRGEQPPDPARVASSAIHNGIIANDDELFAADGFERHDAEMTVDSEVDLRPRRARARQPAARSSSFVGSMATAWMDERRAGVLFLARGVGRPLWTGHTPARDLLRVHARALEVVEDTLRHDAHEARGRTRARCSRSRHGRDGVERAVQPRPLVRRGAAPGRPLRRGGALLPRPARRDRGRAPSGSAQPFRPGAPRRPPRAGARGRGTGTPTTRRGATRTSGRPATP